MPTRHIGPTLVDRRLELAGHRRNEVPSLRDLERTPKLRVGGALVAEAEVLRDRALEEIRGLRNEPDACPEPIERLLAHVEAVHKDDARRDVKAPRHEAHDRALSGAGPADDRRGPSWPRLERQAVQNGTLAVRVRERHVRERDEPRELLRRNRAQRLGDRRGRLDDFDDPLRARLSARDEDDHEDRGHHREEDLHDVLQERGEVPYRHVAAIDEPSAKPQDRDGREIHDCEKGGEGEGEDAIDAQRGRREVRVRRLEPRALRSNANERPHDPYAGDLFPKHLRDPVDLHLDLPEKRDRHPHQHADDRGHERDDHDDEPRQRRVLANGHDDATDREDWRAHEDRERDLHEELDLLNVVGVAGDERSRPEPVHLSRGEALHAFEDRSADVAADAHRRLGGEVHRDDREEAEQQRDPEHDRTGAPDVVGIALGDTVVDDVRVEVGQVEVSHRLEQQERGDDRDLPLIRREVPPKQVNQHGGLPTRRTPAPPPPRAAELGQLGRGAAPPVGRVRAQRRTRRRRQR